MLVARATSAPLCDAKALKMLASIPRRQNFPSFLDQCLYVVTLLRVTVFMINISTGLRASCALMVT